MLAARVRLDDEISRLTRRNSSRADRFAMVKTKFLNFPLRGSYWKRGSTRISDTMVSCKTFSAEK
jgi:hypothetical protein